MSTRSTRCEKSRAGRAGTALLGAAALALIPSYLVWNWVQQTKPFPDDGAQTAAGGATSSTANPEAPAPDVGDPSDAASPLVNAAIPSRGPALISADGGNIVSKPAAEGSGTDANDAAEDGSHELALAAADRERQILRAYRPALPSVFRMRQWTANDGAVAYATYLGRVGADIMLEDETGTKFRIPRDRLSEQDQALLRTLD